MEELVSIVVPVHCAQAYIAETIESVRRQTYQNWELLLVDDCSTDQSVAVIRRYQDERIRLIEKEKNEGAAKARNTGTAQARGRYLAFLDADDIWDSEKLEKELAFMKTRKAAFVFTAYEFGDEDASGTGKIVSVPKRLTYRRALSRTVIFTSTVLFDREQIDAALLHMPAVASEDTATWWQILRAGHTAYGLNEPLVIYRRPAKSLSSNKWQAIRRIWYLYRRVEEVSLPFAAYCFILWAVRATLRRL